MTNCPTTARLVFLRFDLLSCFVVQQLTFYRIMQQVIRHPALEKSPSPILLNVV